MHSGHCVPFVLVRPTNSRPTSISRSALRRSQHNAKPALWPVWVLLHALKDANVTMTAPYLNMKDDYLQEPIERKPLAVVQK
jgi:hypothetical protein